MFLVSKPISHHFDIICIPSRSIFLHHLFAARSSPVSLYPYLFITLFLDLSFPLFSCHSYSGPDLDCFFRECVCVSRTISKCSWERSVIVISLDLVSLFCRYSTVSLQLGFFWWAAGCLGSFSPSLPYFHSSHFCKKTKRAEKSSLVPRHRSSFVAISSFFIIWSSSVSSSFCAPLSFQNLRVSPSLRFVFLSLFFV